MQAVINVFTKTPGTPGKTIGYGLMPLLLASLLHAENTPAKASDGDLQSQAQALIQQFAGQLQPALRDAMQQGGPAQAVTICAEKAPQIARALAQESGWKIRRISLQARNHDTAIPDSWENEQLKQFDLRQKQGEKAADIRYSEIVDNRFRYLQAQGVEPLCLACHGETLDQATQEAVQQRYFYDAATGYKLGEIRGAFSLSKTLQAGDGKTP